MSNEAGNVVGRTMGGSLPELPQHLVSAAVEAALAEDLGLAGDITTSATISQDARAHALLVARQPGIASGHDLAEQAFRALDPDAVYSIEKADGEAVHPGTPLATISGHARAILSAERVALNFMGRMSGIASLTRRYVDAVAGTKATIVDTRKTTPGLRAFEKYAVRCGGGGNHRTGLFDAILIKDNHIAAAGSAANALKAARSQAGHTVKVEIEVDTLDQLREVLPLGPDIILLDNMKLDELREAVRLTSDRALLEASGGVNLESVRGIAETGVDLISVGALTHSAPVLDLGLDFANKALSAGKP